MVNRGLEKAKKGERGILQVRYREANFHFISHSHGTHLLVRFFVQREQVYAAVHEMGSHVIVIMDGKFVD